LTPRELRKLIKQHEGLRLDFKTDINENSISDFAKDLAAFANTEGGQILIGVSNDGHAVGVDFDRDKQDCCDLF
jgi:predicted HTH transcriptional regulator